MENSTNDNRSLLPGRQLRRSGPALEVEAFQGVQIDDPRLAAVLSPHAPLWCLYDGTIHAEGPLWQAARNRLIFSDIPNRRVLGWSLDGRVDVVIDRTYFINGNALDGEQGLIHCEHGRRCMSRSRAGDCDGDQTQPFITHYRGRRLNSPNDVVIASDGAIWFTDPTFGILMPSQGYLAEPELEHRSVYRFDVHTEELARMADFEQPNGLAFSPDHRLLYVSDTSRALGDIPGCQPGSRHEIVAFDVAADGALINRRFFCHTDHGCPDGLLVDERGWVWTSAADGVHIWSPDRERLGFVPLSLVVTNLEFGGLNLKRLFITTPGSVLALDLEA